MRKTFLDEGKLGGLVAIRYTLKEELMVAQGGRWGIFREFEMNMYTLLYLKWVTNKDLLYSTGNSAKYVITIKLGKGFEKE